MSSEFKAAGEEADVEAAVEPRDRTKLIWVAVVAAFAVMVALLWISQRPSEAFSQVRAKHILIKANMQDPVDRQRALARARELRKMLDEGESFEKLAREYSNDPGSSQRGGDLGYSRRGSYDPVFEDYVWSAELNKVSDPVRTAHGYHLIVVVDRSLSAADRYEMDIQRKAKEQFGGGAEEDTTP